jgi:hypothetical protein
MRNNKQDDGKPVNAVNNIRILKGGSEIFSAGGARDKTQKEELDIDSGAGIMLCAKVRHGAFISSLEFKMYVIRSQTSHP